MVLVPMCAGHYIVTLMAESEVRLQQLAEARGKRINTHIYRK